MLTARAVTRCITPVHLPVELAGYASGHRATRVESDLEVNCLALADGNETVVLVSLDLLYVTHGLRTLVLQRLGDLGVEGRCLFMAASHTHYAPAIDETKPLLGTPQTDYRDAIAGVIVAAIRDALTGPAIPVAVHTSSGEAPIGINRRRRRFLRLTRRRIEFNKVGMGPNPTGATDPTVTVVELRSESGTVAYVWSAACHPTGLSDVSSISAHWPGVVRSCLRETTTALSDGEDSLPVLFMQGFAGDVRPPSGRKFREAGVALRRFRLGPTFNLLEREEYLNWARDSADRVCQVATRRQRRETSGTLGCARIEKPASGFALGAGSLPPVSFHRISLGDVVFLGVSGEPVSGYANQVRSLAPDKLVLPIGYIDHVVGYWPTSEMFKEGGYEVVHHCHSFGIDGCQPGIQRQVMDGCRQVLSESPRV